MLSTTEGVYSGNLNNCKNTAYLSGGSKPFTQSKKLETAPAIFVLLRLVSVWNLIASSSLIARRITDVFRGLTNIPFI